MAGVPSGSPTLARMGPHPRVRVSTETDIVFGMDQKPCARMGLPHLPGGPERSTLEPTKVLTCPGGWLDRQVKRRDVAGLEYSQRLKDTTKMSTMAGGGALSAQCAAMGGRSLSTGALAGGGHTQGAKRLQPSPSAGAYDPSKHGWYHPRGQMEERRLADQKEPGGWAWTMHKARDHNGFGEDGIVDKRDNTTAAVSEDAPHHFCGTHGVKTLKGPWGTRKNPIRRCPFVTIDPENQRVRIQARSYRQGENMSIHETLYDGPDLPPPPVASKRKPGVFMDSDSHVATHCNMSRSGAVLKKYVQSGALGRLADETPRTSSKHDAQRARLMACHGARNTGFGHT